MPSREKIVEWLLQAGKDAEQTMPFADEPWKRMAAQVADMRCETCKWSDELVKESVLCLPLDKRFNKNFGCFHHEQKPAG